jgi:hypothetical protein
MASLFLLALVFLSRFGRRPFEYYLDRIPALPRR